MGLFRREAIEASQDRLHGHVILLPRLPHTMLCLFLLCWLVALALFLTQASYSRKETVLGWLEPASGLVRIYPQSEGKLAKLLVNDGDRVVQGQPLAVINGDRVLADGEHLETLLLQEYNDQKLSLERQLAREGTLLMVRDRELQERVATAKQKLLAIVAQLGTQTQRIALADKREERHRELSKEGHVTATELDAIFEQRLLLEREHQALRIEQAQQEALLAQLQANLARLPDEHANNRDSLSLRLSQLSQEIARLRGSRAFVVVASLEGRVSNIGARAGQRVRSERPLLSLIPKDTKLVARLIVPVRAAGFLQSGQLVSLRYDAYPYQKFGLQAAEIIEVATSASFPGEAAHLPFVVREPVYQAQAKPASERIQAYGQALPLKAGMTLSADIQLERRSLLQWLLEPLHSLRGRLT